MDTEEASCADDDPLLRTAVSAPHTVLVIYSVVDTIDRGEAQDLLADLETPKTAQSIAHSLRRLGYHVSLAPIRRESDLLAVLARRHPADTLVFNLCESLGGSSVGEARIPRVLGACGFTYTGAQANNLGICLNKAAAKARLMQEQVPTAAYQVFHRADEPLQVSLPAIVKPAAEDASLGITTKSVVRSEQQLRSQVSYVLQTYKQAVLVEEFLSGREFSASVWGGSQPQILSISEINYTHCRNHFQRILSFSEKWSTDEFPSIDPASLTSGLRKQISQIVLAAYRAMGCRDYARVDLRENKGQVYVLEVNPNPCLAEDGGFAKAARTLGFDYTHMVEALVRLAWQRGDRKRMVNYVYANAAV